MAPRACWLEHPRNDATQGSTLAAAGEAVTLDVKYVASYCFWFGPFGPGMWAPATVRASQEGVVLPNSVTRTENGLRCALV